MDKRQILNVQGKTIEVFLPEGFNLVVNGVAMPPGSKVATPAAPSHPEQSKKSAQHVETKPAPAPAPPTPAAGSFFEQFEALRSRVPRIGLQCVNNENSPYCQFTEESKNCYMTFASYQSEDCMYNTRVFYCRDCADCSFCYKCELCFECIDCINSYNCTRSILCEQAIDCDYCMRCVGTHDCFGCVGLIKKSFHIFNEPYSPEAYKEKLAELRRMTPEEVAEKMEPLLRSVPRAALYGKNNEECWGDNIFNSKKVFWGFDSKNLHDCAYAYHCDDAKDLYDCSHLGWSELCYEIMSGGKLTECAFCFGCWNSNNLEYCELVFNSHDCFGCIGRNHAEYEIFNKKYPKEEYFQRVAALKAYMKTEGSYGKWYPSAYPEVLTAGLA